MEFALVLPLVLVITLGIVEVAVLARAQLEVGHAAREGAREAAASPEPERAVEAVKSALGPGHRDTARVAVARDHRVGGRAEVTVTIRHRVAAPIFGGATVQLTASAVMRVER